MKYKGENLCWIAICDDEANSIRNTKEVLLEGELEPGDFKIVDFSSGNEFLQGNVAKYDLLILDIKFPNENGRDIANEYRKRNKKGLFVYCTDKADPIPEDFNNHPYRYMRKDKAEQMRRYLLDAVDEMYRRRNPPQVQFTEGKKKVLVNVEDILYLEIAKNGCCVYYYDTEKESCTLFVRERLKELYPHLHPYGFEFAHNSYLVNCHYLQRWDSHELELCNGMRMSISRAREKKFREACARYIV